MKTKILTVNPVSPDLALLQEAAETLKRGGLVILPTETVYGIAADMTNQKAVQALIKIKQRSADKPFSVHIEDKHIVEELASDISIAAYKLMDAFWPGPLTVVLKSKQQATVGVRMPDSGIFAKVILMSGVPVVCPSANVSGKPAPTDCAQALGDLDGLVDIAIDGGPTRLGLESSVVDCTVSPVKILREGALEAKQIQGIVGTKTILFVCTGNSCRSVMAEAVLRKKLRELGRHDVSVMSAGMMMTSGAGATEITIEILRRDGIDVSAHRSQRVSRWMLLKSDLILVMERLHEERILAAAPEVKNRLFLLKEFAKIKSGGLDIPDPIGNTADFYEQTYAVIKESVERIVGLI